MSAESSSQPKRIHNRSTAKRDQRLSTRLTPEQKELFERAAAFSGQSLSQFVLNAAQQAALAAIRDHEVVTLSLQDSRAVLAALQHPASPSPRLRQAAEQYRTLIKSDE